MGVETLGIVINRDRKDKTLLTSNEIEIILKAPVIASIPEDPEFSRSAAYSIPLILKNIKSTTYNSIMQLAANILDINYISTIPDKKGLISKLIEGIMGKREHYD